MPLHPLNPLPDAERWLSRNTRRAAAGRARSLLPGAAVAAAVLVASAWWVHRQARRAEQANPPRGRFVHVDGVALHVVEHGPADAPPLVLLHGNGAMAEELALSGLVDAAAERFRVIVFDRPGYGHSVEAGAGHRTPEAQAALIRGALLRLGVERPIVFAHSWATLVALHLALDAPQSLRALVLASGYYRTAPRLDVPFVAAPAVPLIGTLMRHTLSPLVARLLWPLASWRIFSPAPVATAFRERYPVWMSLRPGALHASAAEAGLMQWSALALRGRLRALDAVPTVIVAGEGDKMVRTDWHTRWLHQQLPRSVLRVVPGAGHMVHHTNPQAVLDAIDAAVGRALADEVRRAAPAEPASADHAPWPVGTPHPAGLPGPNTAT